MDSSNRKYSNVVAGSIMVTLARIATSICAFALFWFISQESVSELGAFRTLFIYFLVTEFIPLLGMNQYIIREIAKAPQMLNDYLLHAAIFSLIVASVMGLGIAAVSLYGGYSPVVGKGLLIIIAGIPATAIVLCLQSALIALGKGGDLGIVQGIEVIARTIAGLGLILWSQNVIHVIAGFVVCRWLITGLYWQRLASISGNSGWRLNKKFFIQFLSRTPQFAGILVLFLIIRFAGQLMVPWMEGDTAAGYYAIVYQFLDLILLVPTAFTINLMPVLSQKADVSLDALRRTGTQAMKLVSTLIIPCTLFLFVNCRAVVITIFGDQYQPAVLLVAISVWAGLVFSLDQVLSTSMIAVGKQWADLVSLFVGALVTLAAMYILIRIRGVSGAAVGLLIGTCALFVTRVVIFNLKIIAFNVLMIVWRQIIAGAVMAAAMYLTAFNFIFSGVSGSIVYTVILILLGGFNSRERQTYKELFSNK